MFLCVMNTVIIQLEQRFQGSGQLLIWLIFCTNASHSMERQFLKFCCKKCRRGEKYYLSDLFGHAMVALRNIINKQTYKNNNKIKANNKFYKLAVFAELEIIKYYISERFFSEVRSLLILFFIISVPVSTVEHSWFKWRRIKSYLGNTMNNIV